jgi:hypothetical protein
MRYKGLLVIGLAAFSVVGFAAACRREAIRRGETAAATKPKPAPNAQKPPAAPAQPAETAAPPPAAPRPRPAPVFKPGEDKKDIIRKGAESLAENLRVRLEGGDISQRDVIVRALKNRGEVGVHALQNEIGRARNPTVRAEMQAALAELK